MADAAIQLPENPFRRVAAFQEGGGRFDQVVEVETGAGALAVGEVGEQGMGKSQDGGRPLEHMTRILFKDYLDCVDACAKDMTIVD